LTGREVRAWDYAGREKSQDGRSNFVGYLEEVPA
jgi:hypothetical protein